MWCAFPSVFKEGNWAATGSLMPDSLPAAAECLVQSNHTQKFT